MPADNMNVQRGSTGRLNTYRATSPLPSLESVIPQGGTSVTKQETDSLAIANQSSPIKFKVSERAQKALGSLSTGVQRLVTTHRIAEGMPDKVKERQVIENLKSEINKLVPGGVKLEEDGGKWKVPELVSLYQTINLLPAADRMSLADTTFRRAGQVSSNSEGYAEATTEQFGAAIGAAAVGGTSSVESGKAKPTEAPKGFMGKLITHFEEYKEKIKSWLGIKSTPDHVESNNPEHVITLTNAGALVSDKVFAHEIGHQLQMTDGRWDADKIKEFAKLSGWTETYADGKTSAADGVDNESGREMLFDDRVKPTNENNFVSKYAKTSPTEDFAESYASFVMDPATLMERAPEKFLLINANSRHYSSEQVQSYAKEKGVDLQAVMTKLVLDSGLKPDSLDKIAQVNQVSADKAAILKDSQAEAPKDALGEVAKRITEATLKGEQGFVQGMLTNPEATLGEAWGKLSSEEQAMLKDPTLVQKMIGNVQLGRAGAATLTGQVDMAIVRDGFRQLMLNMVNSPDFRTALASDPQGTLKNAGIWDKLPDEMRTPLVLPNNREALKAMLSKMDGAKYAEGADQNLAKFIDKLTPESFTAFAQQLGDKEFPQRGAENIASIMTTGMAVNEQQGVPPCL
jgi:hypothetical protein